MRSLFANLVLGIAIFDQPDFLKSMEQKPKVRSLFANLVLGIAIFDQPDFLKSMEQKP